MRPASQWQGFTLDKPYLFHMTSNADYFYITLYFLVFYLRSLRCLKNNIKFQQHINHVQGLVVLENSYISHMVSNKNTLYLKVVVLVEIYNFLVLNFFYYKLLRWLKTNIEFEQYINRVPELFDLEKNYLSCMMSDKDTL